MVTITASLIYLSSLNNDSFLLTINNGNSFNIVLDHYNMFHFCLHSWFEPHIHIFSNILVLYMLTCNGSFIHVNFDFLTLSMWF